MGSCLLASLRGVVGSSVAPVELEELLVVGVAATAEGLSQPQGGTLARNRLRMRKKVRLSDFQLPY